MEDTRVIWYQKFVEALEHDAWGQVEEAVETYTRLQVATAAEQEENVLELPPQRRAAIGHLARILALRLEELRGAAEARGPQQRVGLAGMQSLKPFMAGLIVTDVQPPAPLLLLARGGPTTAPGVQLAAWPRGRPQGALGDEEDVASTPEGAEGWVMAVFAAPPPAAGAAKAGAAAARDVFGRGPGAEAGTLRPPPKGMGPGDATLSVLIDSWHTKGADALRDASVVVSVRSGRGQLLEAVQETPPPAGTGEQQLRWGVTVHLQTPLACLGEDWSVFFELRHWKADKKKRSTRAWCMLERDEVAPLLAARAAAPSGGDGHRKALEVYAKPALPTALSAPRLLSSKPLYLYAALHVVRH
ncbi:MAG: cytoskeletal adhesion-domain-containing protein [Monoraphidium minutum]|nr:MAG: cytoskeletal adhesion-domain-containing protein [Monoraphidium minutum]